MKRSQGSFVRTGTSPVGYFPKGMDFAELTREDANRAMDKLNNRPRECLGFKTPNWVFFCPWLQRFFAKNSHALLGLTVSYSPEITL